MSCLLHMLLLHTCFCSFTMMYIIYTVNEMISLFSPCNLTNIITRTRVGQLGGFKSSRHKSQAIAYRLQMM